MVCPLVFCFQILTLAVLVILLTAPIGAVGIAVTGPRLLQRENNAVNPVTSEEEQTGLTADTAIQGVPKKAEF